MKKVIPISCKRLRYFLRKGSKCLVLDCRPHQLFTASSVPSSINVDLSSMLVRRFKGTTASLNFVLPNAEARRALLERHYSWVVVLNEDSQNWETLDKETSTYLVLNTMRDKVKGAKVCFLQGGFKAFQAEFPESCIDQRNYLPEEDESDSIAPCEERSPVRKMWFDEGNPAEILPFMYLGTAYHASSCEILANHNITALLNVSTRRPTCVMDKYTYKWIPMEDSHNTDISSFFQEAIDFINKMRIAGAKVLVHCEAGISRSPTICMAYLIGVRGLSLGDAFEHVKQRRSLVSPNVSFMGQLLEYERELAFAENWALTQELAEECVSNILSTIPIGLQLKHSPITTTSS